MDAKDQITLMENFAEGFVRFKAETFPRQASLYRDLATKGQKPKAMMISCSDSRVMPEVVTDCGPGQMFVCRNAGNVVPPFSPDGGGVTAAIEYAVVGLGVEHIVVCGHTDCGAMKALLSPGALANMPSVAKWLGNCRCSHDVFQRKHGGKIADKEAARVLAMENIVTQLAHLRTHPSVAARLASGDIQLHGWLFDIEVGQLLVRDETDGAFRPMGDLADTGRESAHRRMVAAE